MLPCGGRSGRGPVVPTLVEYHFPSLALARRQGGALRNRIRPPFTGTLGTGPCGARLLYVHRKGDAVGFLTIEEAPVPGDQNFSSLPSRLIVVTMDGANTSVVRCSPVLVS